MGDSAKLESSTMTTGPQGTVPHQAIYAQPQVANMPPPPIFGFTK
jgi:hypothetical protein